MVCEPEPTLVFCNSVYKKERLTTNKQKTIYCFYTEKKENKTFIIYKEIQMGSGAKSYMRKGFLRYEEVRKFFPIYEEAVSHI